MTAVVLVPGRLPEERDEVEVCRWRVNSSPQESVNSSPKGGGVKRPTVRTEQQTPLVGGVVKFGWSAVYLAAMRMQKRATPGADCARGMARYAARV
jgi:hypothetical protein